MRKFLVVLIFMLFPQALWAHAAAAEITEVEQGKLYRVEDGVFTLKDGQSIDLTDRKMLLTFKKSRNCNGGYAILLGGLEQCPETGTRINFVSRIAHREWRELFADKERCFLDVVSVDTPQGAKATMTFRIHCL